MRTQHQTMITVNEADRQELKLLAVKNRTTIISMVHILIKHYKQYDNTDDNN